MIKLWAMHFDDEEELSSATFEIDEPVQALIIESLGSFTPTYREFGHLMIDLSAAQMKVIAADLGYRRSPGSDVIKVCNRVSRVLEMPGED